MKTKPSTAIFLSFTIPFWASFMTLWFWRSMMAWSGGSFDEYGGGWIMLYSIVCGVVSVVLFSFVRRAPLIVVLGVCLIVAIASSQHFNPFRAIDKFSYLIGYGISRLFPYSPKDTPIPSETASAIPPRTYLQVHAPAGRLRILSGDGLLRTVEFDGLSRSIELRPSYVDIGRKGLSFFGFEKWPGYCWPERDGISRCSFWEAKLNFNSLVELLAWLRKQQRTDCPLPYTDDGLVAGCYKSSSDHTLTVWLYQLLVNAKKPMNLPGSENSKFERSNRDQLL